MTGGGCCTSIKPTTRNKPITTHALLTVNIPEDCQANDHQPSTLLDKQPNPKQPPKCPDQCEGPYVETSNYQDTLPTFALTKAHHCLDHIFLPTSYKQLLIIEHAIVGLRSCASAIQLQGRGF